MRITEGQLRRIIREEVRALRESAADDWSAPDPGRLEMMEVAGDAITRIKRGDRPRQVLDQVMAALTRAGVDPYDGLPAVIGAIRRAQGLAPFAEELEALAMGQGY